MAAYLPLKVASQYPNFAKLHNQLTKQLLSRDGTTASLQEKLTELIEDRNDKTSYLEALVIYTELEQLSLTRNQELGGQLLNDVYHVLRYAESTRSLDFVPPNSNVTGLTLLGLSKDELARDAQLAVKTVQKNKDSLINHIENRVSERCEQIAKFYYGADEDTTNNFLFAKSLQLDSVIKTKLKYVTETRFDILEVQAQLNEELAAYLMIVHDILRILWKLLDEFKTKHELEKNRAFDNYYSCIIDSIFLKMKVLRFTVLTSTYDPATIEALQIIRKNLEVQEQEASDRLLGYEKQLRTYKGIGGEFEVIAETYMDVLKAIDTVKDDLRRMTE